MHEHYMQLSSRSNQLGTCLLWNWRRAPLQSFIPHWHVIHWHTQTVVRWVHMTGRASRESSMWGMRVWGPQSQPPSSQGFSNDRVDFSKLAPLITHDPSVLRFPRCTHPWESWQPRVPLSVLFVHQMYHAWCPLWDRGKHQTLPLLFHPPPSCTCPLFFPFPSPSLSFTLSSRSSFLSDTPETAFSVLETNQL